MPLLLLQLLLLAPPNWPPAFSSPPSPTPLRLLHQGKGCSTGFLCCQRRPTLPPPCLSPVSATPRPSPRPSPPPRSQTLAATRQRGAPRLAPACRRRGARLPRARRRPVFLCGSVGGLVGQFACVWTAGLTIVGSSLGGCKAACVCECSSHLLRFTITNVQTHNPPSPRPAPQTHTKHTHLLEPGQHHLLRHNISVVQRLEHQRSLFYFIFVVSTARAWRREQRVWVRELAGGQRMAVKMRQGLVLATSECENARWCIFFKRGWKVVYAGDM